MMKIIVALIYQRDELALKVTGLKVLAFCVYKLNTLHSQSASQQKGVQWYLRYDKETLEKAEGEW